MTSKKRKLANVKVEDASERSELVSFNANEKQTEAKKEVKDLAFGSWQTTKHNRSFML